jgi:glyoxylase-like metal-dependent hydrolase (beta-lactamase superfamily II)
MTRILRVLAPNPGIRELEGTNTWIVGNGPSIVIDPGPDDAGHLREVAREAGHLAAILLTHDHPDHAPGSSALAAATGALVYAARPPEGGERLGDGQRVGTGDVRILAVATPGHSPDHFAFFEERYRSLFTGDAVLGRGTSVIDPPEGDLTAYLRSLKRMHDLSPSVIYPGHGPVVFDAVAKLDEYLAHRAVREGQVLGALAEGPRTPEEIVPEMYGDHPAELHGLAARSVLAHLIKLEADGRAEKRTTRGVVRWSRLEARICVRCGRPVKGRGLLCGPCSLAVLQESS